MLTNLIIILIGTLICGSPLWFFISLGLFLAAPKEDPKRPKKRLMLIISAILFAVLSVLSLILIVSLMNGLAHM